MHMQKIQIILKLNQWLIELDKCANRDTAPAFFEGTPGYEEQMFGVQQNKKSPYDFCGLVLDYDEATHIATIQQRNHFKPGQEIEFLDLKLNHLNRLLMSFMMKKETTLMQHVILFKLFKLKWIILFILII